MLRRCDVEMRERSGSHGSRRNAPQAAHPGCLGGLAQVGRCRHPPAQVRPPPGYRCGRLHFKLPTTFMRTLFTMRPCAQVRQAPQLSRPHQRHGGTRFRLEVSGAGLQRSEQGGKLRRLDRRNILPIASPLVAIEHLQPLNHRSGDTTKRR